MKKVKESIGLKEYKDLLIHSRGIDNIKENSRLNIQRTFTILFYTGLRLNEIQSLRIKHIKELIISKSTIIETSKTNSERKLYASEDFIKALKPFFDLEEDLENRVIQKLNKPREGIAVDTYLKQINGIIKTVLKKGYSSHSFRQGLITDMAERGVNVKIISEFISHKNIATTLGYVKPSQDTIKNALIR